MTHIENLNYGATLLSDRNQQVTMWGGSNYVMKPTQGVTTGNPDFTSGFEVAPKISPLISLSIGELDQRGGLDGIGIEDENSPVSPFIKLLSFGGQVGPLDLILKLNPTLSSAQPRGPEVIRMIIWYPIHPWFSGNQNESGFILVPSVTFELLGNPWWHQVLVRTPRTVSPE